MATRSYTGAAVLKAQISYVTPGGTIAATDTFSVKIGGTTYTFTSTGATVAAVVTGLYNLIVAGQALSESPEWLEVTVTDNTTELRITANTAGKPFTVTSAINNISGGAAPTLTVTTPTANSGPEQYDLAANWSGATLPVSTDTAIIEGDYKLRYGDLSTVLLAKLIVRDFTGEIGLPPIDADGLYPQYRSQSFTATATVTDIMSTSTSQLIRLANAADVGTWNVYGSGTPLVDTIKAVTITGTNVSNIVNVMGGSVGIATEAGETATVATLRLLAGELEIGLGVTLAAMTQDGGTSWLYCDAVQFDILGGTSYLIDDPDITTLLTITNATVFVNGGPTITVMTIYAGGKLDCTQDIRPFTVTTGEVYEGAEIDDRYGRGTWTNDVIKHTDFDKVTLRMGVGKAVGFA